MGVWAHNRKVDADARAHRCRQQRSTRGAASCRDNFVRDTTAAAEYGADRNPPRFDAPDSAHYAYRRTLTCGPWGCGSASHHTIGSTVHLSVGSRRALLVVQGGAAGLLFSPMNALAVLVERDYPKSSKNSFRPQGHVKVVYLGPVAPHWEVHGVFGDGRLIDEFRQRPRPTAAAAAPRPTVPPQPRAGRPRRRTRAPHPRVGPGVRGAETALTRSGRLRIRRRCLRRLPMLCLFRASPARSARAGCAPSPSLDSVG
jgi:hypothetical protein